MTANFGRYVAVAAIAAVSVASAGCGEFVRTGQSPSLLVIRSLEAASGAEPDSLGSTLRSDVITLIPREDDLGGPYYSFYNDIGEVTLAIQLHDQGAPGSTVSPSPVNAVTINRYRVSFRRTDNHNVQGVDVPYAFESAATFLVPADGSVTAGFDLVRHSAKQEAPLRGLGQNGTFISTIADVTFFGRDQAGNEVSVMGSIGVTFGNFADPE